MDASADSMKNDIVRFITSLKGADSNEISTMLVIANVIRLQLIDSGRIPAAALDLSIPRDHDLEMKCEMSPIALGKLVKHLQGRDKLTDALGVMIWFHSIRALNVPQIRILGREMWGELSRGFLYAEDVIEEIRLHADDPLPPGIDSEVYFIPCGLEPLK